MKLLELTRTRKYGLDPDVYRPTTSWIGIVLAIVDIENQIYAYQQDIPPRYTTKLIGDIHKKHGLQRRRLTWNGAEEKLKGKSRSDLLKLIDDLDDSYRHMSEHWIKLNRRKAIARKRQGKFGYVA